MKVCHLNLFFELPENFNTNDLNVALDVAISEITKYRKLKGNSSVDTIIQNFTEYSEEELELISKATDVIFGKFWIENKSEGIKLHGFTSLSKINENTQEWSDIKNGE